MAESNQKPHALLITFPLQGHIIPSVNLALKLAAKGFTITFVNTEFVHSQTIRAATTSSTTSTVDHDIFAAARPSGLDIRYELISDGLPVSFDRSANFEKFASALLHIFSAHVEDLMQRLSAVSPPITCLIADTFYVWPATLAKKFGIPYVSFWTEPAIVFLLYYHLELLITNGHCGSKDHRKDTIRYIPGVPAIEPTDLMSYLQETADISTSTVHKIIHKAFDEAKRADIVLCNTVQELEPDVIAALQHEKPFYAIGPLFPASSFAERKVATSLWPESDCSQWMSSKPPRSILYISFGSFAPISRKDLEEIANGVLDSKASFIWVMRPGAVISSDEPNPLPRRFLEESQGQGIVVPWCSQKQVLSHPSLGGFFTHCGWNSILESIWCEVPMLCFPLLTDQFTNRKLVAKDWRIGLDMGGIDKASREVVSKGINDLMQGEVGEGLRKEIKEVKKKLERALAVPNGSSLKNFDQFIVDLMNHSRQNGVRGVL